MSAERIFFIAPPQRQAIIELAVGYATFLNEEERGTIQSVRKAAKRLRDAQDAFGIELIKRHQLGKRRRHEQQPYRIPLDRTPGAQARP